VMRSEEPRLPPGYWLDRGDPDIWSLRRSEGWIVPTSVPKEPPGRP
jgi:hypothetical protein